MQTVIYWSLKFELERQVKATLLCSNTRPKYDHTMFKFTNHTMAWSERKKGLDLERVRVFSKGLEGP